MAASLITAVTPVWFTMYVLATLLTGARLIARYKGPMKRLASDDWLLLASWVFLTGHFIGWIAMVVELTAFRRSHAIGKSSREESLKMVEAFFKGLYVVPTIGYVSVMLSKFSILALYRRLFSGVARMKSYLAAISLCLWIADLTLIFWRLFGCVPVADNWRVTGLMSHNSSTNTMVATNRCVSVSLLPSMDALYAVDIIADLCLIALAVPLLRMTNLSRWDSVGVFLTFSLVGVTIAASTIREVMMKTTRNIVIGTTWAFVEACLCVVVASMVGLRHACTELARCIKAKIQQLRRIDPSDQTDKENRRNSYATMMTMVCKGISGEDDSTCGNSASCRSSASAAAALEMKTRKMDEEEGKALKEGNGGAKKAGTMSIVIGRSVTVEEARREESEIPPVPELPQSRAGSIQIVGGNITRLYGW